jgi:hypothetical protein
MSVPSDRDDLLAELRAPVSPVTAPEAATAQRARVVQRMRELQSRAAARRASRKRWFKRIGPAVALAALSSVAAAAWLSSNGASEAIAPQVPAPPPSPPSRNASVPEPQSPPAPVVEDAPRSAELAPAPGRRRPAPRGSVAPAQASTLAEENALLTRALASSRSGNDVAAVGLHDALIARYPRSPLARNAELERLRALSRLGNAAATRAAARRYLAKYPDGMGADEARRLALDPG